MSDDTLSRIDQVIAEMDETIAALQQGRVEWRNRRKQVAAKLKAAERQAERQAVAKVRGEEQYREWKQSDEELRKAAERRYGKLRYVERKWLLHLGGSRVPKMTLSKKYREIAIPLLIGKGLIDADGQLTPAGWSVHAAIEANPIRISLLAYWTPERRAEQRERNRSARAEWAERQRRWKEEEERHQAQRLADQKRSRVRKLNDIALSEAILAGDGYCIWPRGPYDQPPAPKWRQKQAGLLTQPVPGTEWTTRKDAAEIELALWRGIRGFR